MTLSFYDIAALFLAYSFLGWCTEVIYAGMTTGKVINRGFLNGPVCPIYGFGMIGVLLFLDPIADNTVLLFVAGMLLCSLLELVGGWALKQFFHTRWWDYTNRPLNIGGYVCLGFSLVWGLAVVFVIRLVQPVVLDLVELAAEVLPGLLLWGLVAFLYAAFIADLVLTLITIIGLQKKIQELEKVANALHSVSDELSQRLGKGAISADARFDNMKLTGKERLEAEKREMEEAISESREYLTEQKEKLQDTVAEGREKLQEQKEKLQDTVAEGREKLQEQKERAEASITARKQQAQHSLSDTREKLQERREQLEARQKELVASIGGPRFGMRRLVDAFPALHTSLRERVWKESESGSDTEDRQD